MCDFFFAEGGTSGVSCHSGPQPIPAVDLFVAGFSCTSVSSENGQRAQHKECVEKGTGLTGITWTGVHQYTQRRRPNIIVCENVAGLARSNQGMEPQILPVMRSFEACGYVASWRLLNALFFGLPHRRRRVYMWAFAKGSPDLADVAMPSTVQRMMCQRHKPWDAIFPQTSEPPSSLTERQQSVVQEALERHRRKRQRSGEAEGDIFVDIAKSASRCPYEVGATPCLLPNSSPYRVMEQRLLSPTEVLGCQGIWAEDYPYVDTLMAQKGGPRLLRNLAGNAFSSTVAMSVLLAAWLHGGLTPEEDSV